MQKTPKPVVDKQPAQPKQEKESASEEDIEKRGYYYDDAHGYETYVPDEPCDDMPNDQA